MPRPNLDEDIVAKVRQIHRDTQGEPAGSFQEALDTVIQLAVQATGEETAQQGATTGWYPGKYAGMVFDRVVEAAESRGTAESQYPSTRPSDSGPYRQAIDRDPETTAFFKTHLDEGYTVRVPPAEAEALGFDEGDILQVLTYRVD